MLTHTRLGRLRALSTVFGAMLVLAFSAACDKVPLTAPTGAIITLFSANSIVPLNGEIEIVATVIENGAAPASPVTPGTGTTGGTTSTTTAGAGTPVQNGTVVSFTSSLGSIDPAEARTNNGQVRVRFRAGGQSGTASITAFSGGASGKLENLKIGTAAVERVLVTANPQTLGPFGGISVISARVEDLSGSPLGGVPVLFTADQGTLTPAAATTDQSGVAVTNLNTTTKAIVTANVAGKTAPVTVGLNARTGVTISGPTQSISAGLPATFNVGVAATAIIRDVTVNFGDGTQQSLGGISGPTAITHPYLTPGTFTVRAIATDATGFSEQVATSVTILPSQPPGVIITPSNSRPAIGQIITLTATVTGATSTIQSFEWDFGDGTPIVTVTSPQVTKSYATPGTKIITVTVEQAVGATGRGQTAVDVQPGPAAIRR